MKIRYLLEKEVKLFMRNPFMPRMVIMLPAVMMLVLPMAATLEVKNVNVAVVDSDRSTVSQRLISKGAASSYFNVVNLSQTYDEALREVEYGRADVILEIPAGVERNLYKEGFSHVSIAANTVNGTKGLLGSRYLGGIVLELSDELRRDAGMMVAPTQAVGVPRVELKSDYRFNSTMNYKFFMLPALLVMILTLICGFLPALSIVSEKEVGTMEQINVSPVSEFKFVLGKLIPFWVIGFIVIIIGLLVSRFVYGLIPTGSLVAMGIATMVFILAISGLGLIVSNRSDTMQQGMFVMFFFLLVFILLSGLFTSISSMPQWAQNLTIINPLKYFIEIMRQVFLKGSSVFDIMPNILALLSFAVVANLWAVLSYKKVGK